MYVVEYVSSMEFRQFKWVTGNANESPCWRIKRKPEKRKS